MLHVFIYTLIDVKVLVQDPLNIRRSPYIVFSFKRYFFARTEVNHPFVFAHFTSRIARPAHLRTFPFPLAAYINRNNFSWLRLAQALGPLQYNFDAARTRRT